MAKCFCPKKFDIPECCQRYLEDPMGLLVHTETVCYEKDQDGVFKAPLWVPPEPIATNTIG